MTRRTDPQLSRRERQIMDIIYARGRASVGDVHAALADPPSYSAVRTLIRVLEKKGHLRHEQEGVKYVYLPTQSRRQAARSAVQRLLATFFDGSATQAIAALLEVSDSDLTAQETAELRQLIDKLRKEGR